jgi:hypothetical protein
MLPLQQEETDFRKRLEKRGLETPLERRNVVDLP